MADYSLYQRAKELREERAQELGEADSILRRAHEEGRELKPDESEKIDRIHDGQEARNAEIERVERQLGLEAEAHRVDPPKAPRSVEQDTEAAARADEENAKADRKRSRITDEDVALGIRAFLTEGNENADGLRVDPDECGFRSLTPEQRKAFQCRGGSATSITIPLPSWRQQVADYYGVRAQSKGTDSEGGYLVPEGFFPRLTESLLAWGGMRRARTFILRTATGQKLPMPTVDDTSNTGELIGENVELNEQDVTFSEIQLDAYKYSSKVVRVSFELLNDSAIDLPGFLGRALGTRLGRVTNQHYTTGTGSSQPNGVVTAATSAATTASATAVTYTELLDLKHNVDPAYRAMAEWMFNDSTLLALKKLTDGNGRPLWQAGMAVGEPNAIDGDPYVINQDVADMGSNAKPILYGDFSQYVIRDVGNVRLLRLDERYAEYDQVAFVALMRTDSDLLDAGTNPIEFLTNAA